MEYSLIINRDEATEIIRKTLKKSNGIKELAAKKGTSVTEVLPSPMLVSMLLKTILQSPAYAIRGENAIYLQGDWREEDIEHLPAILNHEELHLLIDEALKEEGYFEEDLSKDLIDESPAREIFCSACGMSSKAMKEFQNYWKVTQLPGIKTVRKVIKFFQQETTTFREGVCDLLADAKLEIELSPIGLLLRGLKKLAGKV